MSLVVWEESGWRGAPVTTHIPYMNLLLFEIKLRVLHACHIPPH